MSLHAGTLVVCLLLAIIAHGQGVMADERDDEYRRDFKLIDADEDGSITVEEFEAASKAGGYDLTHEEIHTIFTKLDTDDVNFNQFKESGGRHEDAVIAIQLVLGRGWRETEFLDQKMPRVLHSRSDRNMRKWNTRARRDTKQTQRLRDGLDDLLAAFRSKATRNSDPLACSCSHGDHLE